MPQPRSPVSEIFRALAVGDSFVEGYTVALDKTATQVAEKALGAPGCAVEVLNGGTAAWSTDQEYLFYKEEGVRYAPQVLLVFFYYNDLLGNTTARYWGSPKPLLAESGGRLVITNDPVPRPGPPAPVESANPSAPPPAYRGSVALEWVRDRVAHIQMNFSDRVAPIEVLDRATLKL